MDKKKGYIFKNNNLNAESQDVKDKGSLASLWGKQFCED